MSKKDELTEGLQSTLNLLRLPPSELKKARDVRAGENRPDLVIGQEAEPLPTVPVPEIGVSSAGLPGSPATPKQAPFLSPAGAKPVPKAVTAAIEQASEPIHRFEIRLRGDQLEILTDLELKLRQRGLRNERLTKASIVRGLVDALPYLDLDLAEAIDEDALRSLIFKCLGLKKRSQPAAKTPPNE